MGDYSQNNVGPGITIEQFRLFKEQNDRLKEAGKVEQLRIARVNKAEGIVFEDGRRTSFIDLVNAVMKGQCCISNPSLLRVKCNNFRTKYNPNKELRVYAIQH